MKTGDFVLLGLSLSLCLLIGWNCGRMGRRTPPDAGTALRSVAQERLEAESLALAEQGCTGSRWIVMEPDGGESLCCVQRNAEGRLFCWRPSP